MSDTRNAKRNGDLGPKLLAARKRAGLGREKVAAQLDPPVSSKTIERWEEPGKVYTRIERRRFYLTQFEELYGEKLR